MLNFVFALFTAFTAFSAFALDQKAFDEQFAVKELAKDTYQVTDKFYHDSNVLVARMPDGTVVIASSPFETVGAQLMMDWIKEKWDPKRIVAVNTHFHSDGTGGNEAYKQAGAEIWASDLTWRLHRQSTKKDQQALADGFKSKPELRDRILKRKTVHANRTFKSKEGKIFDFGGEKVELIFPGEGHTSDNSVVYLPQRKVLFGGCLIRSAKHDIGYLGDAVVKPWAETVRNVQKLKPEIVIPGHGPVGGPELLTRTIDLAEKEAAKGTTKN
uniref:beta-lactamase n=3 Tax=Enterobacterales TaxID=91347 RepID=A0A7U3MVS9_CITFR|nr:subclass B1 metallo-beta-lactamase GMB-1 [Citrobacter freundii]QXI66703.1 GMB-1 [Serratia marcescens]QXI66747.1 GMB-1 [Raoultella planticola]QKF95688.1 subclass B1 metallo-beta-lactamase GMB-1 [Citrobacter freundii]QXO83654.1 GMB-1 [Citrobacter freundii]UCK92102.1 GMB-1 [Citrobacter freundii]